MAGGDPCLGSHGLRGPARGVFDSDPFRLSYFEDQFYVSLGTARCPSDPAGRIVTLDPISGATSTVFTAPDGYIAAIGLDQEYLFASTYGRRQLGGPFGGCELVPPGVKTAQVSPGYVALANKYPGGSGNGYALHLHNGRVAAFYSRGDGASRLYAGVPGLEGGFIADGRWHHVALVVDAAGGRLFVDAVQTASLGWTGTAGPCTTTAPLLLGTYPLAGPILSLDGRLDAVALWSRALAPEEVRAAMQFKVQVAHPGLVGYWPLDEGAGDVAGDTTGRGHVGALLQGPVWVTSDAPMFP